MSDVNLERARVCVCLCGADYNTKPNFDTRLTVMRFFCGGYWKLIIEIKFCCAAEKKKKKKKEKEKKKKTEN